MPLKLSTAPIVVPMMVPFAILTVGRRALSDFFSASSMGTASPASANDKRMIVRIAATLKKYRVQK
jgi:hypothetical protein